MKKTPVLVVNFENDIGFSHILLSVQALGDDGDSLTTPYPHDTPHALFAGRCQSSEGKWYGHLLGIKSPYTRGIITPYAIEGGKATLRAIRACDKLGTPATIGEWVQNVAAVLKIRTLVIYDGRGGTAWVREPRLFADCVEHHADFWKDKAI